MNKDFLKENMNEYLPLRDLVFNTLRQAIITGELAPGERLMEISLANQLGVSRTPVREAIRKLELEGLVIMIPRKGAQVARITEKSLRDVIEIRIVLEEFAAELASQRITAEGKAELIESHNAFVKTVDDGDMLKIAEADQHFHDVIFRIADNDRLGSIIEGIREQFYRYRLEYVKDVEARSVLVEEHAKMTEAILRGDGNLARQIMGTHIKNQQECIVKTIQK